MRLFKVLSVAAVAAMTVTGVAAKGMFDEAADAIEYRQNTFSLVRYQFGDMKAMLKGKVDYDSERFILRAESLAALSKMPFEAFGAGTDQGKTSALPAIWKNKADFEKQAKVFGERADALLVAAKSGDKKAMSKAFGEIGKSCKGCHKKYKD